MRKRQFLLYLIATALCVTLSSCFKDEPKNAEADILQVTLNLSSDAKSQILYNSTDATKKVITTGDKNQKIVFTARMGADLSAIPVNLTLTEGATVIPASGSVLDFSNGQTHEFHVTSQDGKWHRTYTIGFVEDPIGMYDNPWEKCYFIDFENSTLNINDKGEGYYEWDGLCTANGGFKIAKSSAKPDEYPSALCDDGYEGKCIMLRTLKTGQIAIMMGKRLAAGNLFVGEFDIENALKKTLESTHFGVPVGKLPTHFSLYYQYTPGETMQNDKGLPIPDEVDECAMYCVVYRNHDSEGKPVMLTGVDILTNKNIVGIARMESIPAMKEWTKYDVDFVYTQDIDRNLLVNRGYNLAMVCSSSKNGDLFQGAIGSTLKIDNIRIDYSE